MATPDRSEDVWPYPRRAVETASGPVSVTDAGDGPTLLLVHVGLWSFVWRGLLELLTPAFRCVTLDAPGTGLSHRPAPEEVTLEAAADAVRAVIDALGIERLTLVLHDLGGPAGLAAVSPRPGLIEGIVAVNTFGWRPEGPAFRGMLVAMGSRPVEAFDAATGLLPRLTATRFGVGRHLDREARRSFLRGMDRSGRRAFHRYMRDARRADALFESAEEALDGPLADRPLLTVFGERNDPLDFQPRWKALFPHLHRVVVPRGYHFPMCDAPRLVAQAIAAWHGDEVSRGRG